MKFKIVPSKVKGKKYTAIFECPKCNKTKTIHFGADCGRFVTLDTVE